MAQFEISVLEYGTDYRALMGVYDGETAFDAVIAYAKDAGLDIPTADDVDSYRLGGTDFYAWGKVYTPEDYCTGEIKTYNAIGCREYNACVVKVEE